MKILELHDPVIWFSILGDIHIGHVDKMYGGQEGLLSNLGTNIK